MTLIGATTLWLLALPTPARADAPPQWWQSPPVQSRLSLSQAQVERLDALYRESLPRRRQLHREVRHLQELLARQLATGSLDDRHTLPLIERLSAAERRRRVTRTMMLIRMYRELTPTQRAQLTALSPGPPEAPADPILALLPR
jgi:Spy/CpxP family protein refolding chaperone